MKMNYSEFVNIKNTSDYDISIVPASEIGLDSEFENITDKYMYLVNLTRDLQDALIDNVFYDIAVPVSFLYLLVLILGVFGNVTTCIVIIKSSLLRNATNYYLFNLAVSDLILLIIGKILI